MTAGAGRADPEKRMRSRDAFNGVNRRSNKFQDSVYTSRACKDILQIIILRWHY